MQVAYRLNANELDINFLESIKKLFPEKSINNIENHKDKLIHKDLEDLG